jgi:hypothetical protein
MVREAQFRRGVRQSGGKEDNTPHPAFPPYRPWDCVGTSQDLTPHSHSKQWIPVRTFEESKKGARTMTGNHSERAHPSSIHPSFRLRPVTLNSPNCAEAGRLCSSGRPTAMIAPSSYVKVTFEHHSEGRPERRGRNALCLRALSASVNARHLPGLRIGGYLWPISRAIFYEEGHRQPIERLSLYRALPSGRQISGPRAPSRNVDAKHWYNPSSSCRHGHCQ